MVYDAETTTVTLSVVNDAETTTHTEEAVTQSVVNDAETQKKLLHSPWSMMLKHRRSCYTVRGQRC